MDDKFKLYNKYTLQTYLNKFETLGKLLKNDLLGDLHVVDSDDDVAICGRCDGHPEIEITFNEMIDYAVAKIKSNIKYMEDMESDKL